jgi:hypothetical protein
MKILTDRHPAGAGASGAVSPILGADEAQELQSRIDRILLAAALCVGTWVLALPGIALIVRAVSLHRKGSARGLVLRNGAITIVAFLCLVDGLLNYLYWGADLLFAHDTVLVHTMLTSVGRLWDGAYYLGFNATAPGGVGISSEKGFEVVSVLLMYPMRIVAAYGFMKMKRWGLQFMIVSAWMYVFFWICYIATLTHEFSWRFSYTAWGILGWWIMDIWYLYPMVLVPFLHSLDRRLWR